MAAVPTANRGAVKPTVNFVPTPTNLSPAAVALSPKALSLPGSSIKSFLTSLSFALNPFVSKSICATAVPISTAINTPPFYII